LTISVKLISKYSKVKIYKLNVDQSVAVNTRICGNYYQLIRIEYSIGNFTDIVFLKQRVQLDAHATACSRCVLLSNRRQWVV